MRRDEELMLEFQKGSQDAFSELFMRYRAPLFGFFRRRLSNATRAEELTQECFLAVLQGVERYEPRATFRTYVYAIALHLTAAEYRRAKREAVVAREASGGGAGDGRADGGVAVAAERVASPERDLGVRRAIASLDDDHREVLLLREYEGLSYDEIAVALRIPVNTVRSRLFRARMAVKSLLEPLPQRLQCKPEPGGARTLEQES